MSQTLLLHPRADIAGAFLPGFRIQDHAGTLAGGFSNVVYFPAWVNKTQPNLRTAGTAVGNIEQATPQRVVLVSSSLIYGASFRNPGMMSEARNLAAARLSGIAREWLKLEALFQAAFPSNLIILRIAPCPLIEPDSLLGQLLRRREIPCFRLFDPPLQFLHPNDLTDGIRVALKSRPVNTFNIIPGSVITPGLLVKHHGWKKAAMNGMLKDVPGLGADVKNLFRHPWTVSGAKAARELGYQASHSAHEALDLPPPSAGEKEMLDPFGMDVSYIRKQCDGIAGFLHDRYFRIQYEGHQNLPASGGAVLVGIHRGFMPFDGLMLLNYLYTRHNALVRILTHNALFKNPVPFDFRKLGGIPPTASNLDAVLQMGHWAGVFPEGIEGAFRYYERAHQIGYFGRNEFVACAIRNQVPIIPFVTIGSAEIFPIVAKFQWKWLQRQTLWPCFPIAPPFPLLPVPLPTKWKTVFLDPIHVEQTCSPSDANDRGRVVRLGEEIKTCMQEKLLALRAARKSWWF